jgi:hypothetical protein
MKTKKNCQQYTFKKGHISFVKFGRPKGQNGYRGRSYTSPRHQPTFRLDHGGHWPRPRSRSLCRSLKSRFYPKELCRTLPNVSVVSLLQILMKRKLKNSKKQKQNEENFKKDNKTRIEYICKLRQVFYLL